MQVLRSKLRSLRDCGGGELIVRARLDICFAFQFLRLFLRLFFLRARGAGTLNRKTAGGVFEHVYALVEIIKIIKIVGIGETAKIVGIGGVAGFRFGRVGFVRSGKCGAGWNPAASGGVPMVRLDAPVFEFVDDIRVCERYSPCEQPRRYGAPNFLREPRSPNFP